jgi:hypothetical protein
MYAPTSSTNRDDTLNVAALSSVMVAAVVAFCRLNPAISPV